MHIPNINLVRKAKEDSDARNQLFDDWAHSQIVKLEKDAIDRFVYVVEATINYDLLGGRPCTSELLYSDVSGFMSSTSRIFTIRDSKIVLDVMNTVMEKIRDAYTHAGYDVNIQMLIKDSEDHSKDKYVYSVQF